MRPDLQELAALVVKWASTEPEIARVWFFGSRARGNHSDQSDLDIAILTIGCDKGTRLGHYCAVGDRWQKQLAELLPVRVHLKNGDVELRNPVVARAVAREGIPVFSRPEWQFSQEPTAGTHTRSEGTCAPEEHAGSDR